MKRHRAILITILLPMIAALSAPAAAAPASGTLPSVESSRIEVQRRCHHYRWSSRSHCTSAQLLRQYAPLPRHYYPYRYYGGAPHYAYAYPYYGYRWPYFGPYGFYRHRLHRGYFWY